MTFHYDAILVYDQDSGDDLWLDRELIDPEIHSEYEPEVLAEDILNMNTITQDVLWNPHNMLCKELAFPPTWDFKRNSFYMQVFHEFAMALYDDMDVELADEIKSGLLSRMGLK